jgi:hypothetical protein
MSPPWDTWQGSTERRSTPLSRTGNRLVTIAPNGNPPESGSGGHPREPGRFLVPVSSITWLGSPRTLQIRTSGSAVNIGFYVAGPTGMRGRLCNRPLRHALLLDEPLPEIPKPPPAPEPKPDRAALFRAMLAGGQVGSRAELARALGCSRAWVTKVLGSAKQNGTLECSLCMGAVRARSRRVGRDHRRLPTARSEERVAFGGKGSAATGARPGRGRGALCTGHSAIAARGHSLRTPD